MFNCFQLCFANFLYENLLIANHLWTKFVNSEFSLVKISWLQFVICKILLLNCFAYKYFNLIIRVSIHLFYLYFWNLSIHIEPRNYRRGIFGDTIELHRFALHGGLVHRWNNQKSLSCNIRQRRQHTCVKRFNKSVHSLVSEAYIVYSIMQVSA